MGWDPAAILPSGPFEHQSRNVKQILDGYRQKCISTCLLYPTFRSSAVIMTLGAARTPVNGTPMLGPPSVKGAHRRLEMQADATPLVQGDNGGQGEGSAFLRFWWNEQTRDGFLSQLPSNDLASMRRACHDFSVRAAPFLFDDMTITFRASTFTRPARMAALERIGHHVRTLTFRMPHTAETFLPPLLDPYTGEERVFIYEPQMGGRIGGAGGALGPKYGSWEMTDMLIKQYGPLFHAATNVPAFVRALAAMPLIGHLKISCPGQEPSQRYRRGVVDYALISLRMAVERAPLGELRTLSLLPIHPGGLLYLRPVMGFGALPSGLRRWTQIRQLAIHMDGWPFDDRATGADHLRLLHDYLALFAPRLERVSFRWRGIRGPCPFTLDTHDAIVRPASISSTSPPPPLLPLSTPPPQQQQRSKPRRIRFPHLRHAELSNAHPHAAQVNRFIKRHRRTLRECDFDQVELRSGTWDEALAVLTKLSGSDAWKAETELVDSPAARAAAALVRAHSAGELSCGGGSVGVGVDARGRGGVGAHAVGADADAEDVYFGSPEHMKEFLRRSVMSAKH